MKDTYKSEFSEKQARKMSEAWNVKNSLVRQLHEKRVRCIETGVIYDSVTKAAEMVGCTRGNIYGHLHGRSKTAKKLHWEYV